MLVRALLSKIAGSLVWKIQTRDPVLFLTFDDGPIPVVTPWVLKQLAAYHAQATFFCIGDNIQRHPDIFKNVLEQGHAVGNHTFHHLNGWKTRNEDYFRDIALCDETLVNNSASPAMKLFRPPYGRIKPSQVSRLKATHRIVMWDVLTKDYNQKLNGEDCLRHVVNKTRAGSILVFHDSLKAESRLKVVLPGVLEHFSNKGYSFQKLTLDT